MYLILVNINQDEKKSIITTARKESALIYTVSGRIENHVTKLGLHCAVSIMIGGLHMHSSC